MSPQSSPERTRVDGNNSKHTNGNGGERRSNGNGAAHRGAERPLISAMASKEQGVTLPDQMRQQTLNEVRDFVSSTPVHDAAVTPAEEARYVVEYHNKRVVEQENAKHDQMLAYLKRFSKEALGSDTNENLKDIVIVAQDLQRRNPHESSGLNANLLEEAAFTLQGLRASKAEWTVMSYGMRIDHRVSTKLAKETTQSEVKTDKPIAEPVVESKVEPSELPSESVKSVEPVEPTPVDEVKQPVKDYENTAEEHIEPARPAEPDPQPSDTQGKNSAEQTPKRQSEPDEPSAKEAIDQFVGKVKDLFKARFPNFAYKLKIFFNKRDDMKVYEEDITAANDLRKQARLNAERESYQGIEVGGYSEAKRRNPERNDDARMQLPEREAVGVFDGIGGFPKGEVASRLAAQTVTEMIVDFPKNLTLRETGEELLAIVKDADAVVSRKRSEAPDLKSGSRMGTTALVAKLWRGRTGEIVAPLVHAGDSRAYKQSGSTGRLEQVTLDHNAFYDSLAEGKAWEQQAEDAQSPVRKSYTLTNALGYSNAGPELSIVEMQPGDRLILLTDGALNLKDQEIWEAILSGDCERDSRSLVAAARKRGLDKRHPRCKPDDYTAVILKA